MASSWKHRSRSKVLSSEPRSIFPPDSALSEEQLASRHGFLATVENRLAEDPETKATLDRLVDEGISESDAKLFLSHLVAREVFSVMKDSVKVERGTYLKWLAALPNLPQD